MNDAELAKIYKEAYTDSHTSALRVIYELGQSNPQIPTSTPTPVLEVVEVDEKKEASE